MITHPDKVLFPEGGTMAERLEAVGELWAEIAASGQSVREASERMKQL